MRKSVIATVGLFAAAASMIAVWETPAVGQGSPAVIRTDPRTPITTLPFTINECGSFFLTDCLAGVSGMDGITIAADDVTIDLNGFTLTGVSGSLHGINAPAAVNNVTIMNGSVAHWGGNGLELSQATDVKLVGVTASSNGVGMVVNRAELDSCTVTQNFSGINATSSVLRRCLSSGNIASGFDLTDSQLIDSTLDGSGSQRGVFIHGGQCRIQNCDLSFTNGVVVWVHDGSHHSIDGNRILGAAGQSIYIFAATHSVIVRNQIESVIRNDGGPTNNVAPTEAAGTSVNPWANLQF